MWECMCVKMQLVITATNICLGECMHMLCFIIERIFSIHMNNCIQYEYNIGYREDKNFG
jgi:hypothetical protein